MLGSFYPAWKSARRQLPSVWFSFWATGSRPGACGRLRRWGVLPALPGILPFYNYYCSQRACTLEKGAGAAEGKLLSQLSFSVCAGQVVFRAALQQNYDRGAWRHRGVYLMSLFFARVMLCVMCFCFFLGAFLWSCVAARAAGHTGRSPRLPPFGSFGFRD